MSCIGTMETPVWAGSSAWFITSIITVAVIIVNLETFDNYKSMVFTYPKMEKFSSLLFFYYSTIMKKKQQLALLQYLQVVFMALCITMQLRPQVKIICQISTCVNGIVLLPSKHVKGLSGGYSEALDKETPRGRGTSDETITHNINSKNM